MGIRLRKSPVVVSVSALITKELELFFADSYSCANSIRCLPQLFINAAADSEWIGVSRLDPRSSAKQDR